MSPHSAKNISIETCSYRMDLATVYGTSLVGSIILEIYSTVALREIVFWPSKMLCMGTHARLGGRRFR
jgi:hypothetical protein